MTGKKKNNKFIPSCLPDLSLSVYSRMFKSSIPPNFSDKSAVVGCSPYLVMKRTFSVELLTIKIKLKFLFAVIIDSSKDLRIKC